MGKRIEVGVLGATGMVGQQFINQLAGHPWFELTWLAARDGLVDTQAWRVNLREFQPVGRFGASFYVRCGDRFVMGGADGLAGSTETPIDRL